MPQRQHAAMTYEEEEEAAETKAKRLGIAFCVVADDIVVFDGGARSWREQGEWERHYLGSRRPATDEEIELWLLLGP